MQAGPDSSLLRVFRVGKSTLTNTLAGNPLIDTQAVREADNKGRHTTTSRQLHIVPQVCAVIDTPGMRELQLTDAATGIKETFVDLHELDKIADLMTVPMTMNQAVPSKPLLQAA